MKLKHAYVTYVLLILNVDRHAVNKCLYDMVLLIYFFETFNFVLTQCGLHPQTFLVFLDAMRFSLYVSIFIPLLRDDHFDIEYR